MEWFNKVHMCIYLRYIVLGGCGLIKCTCVFI